MFLRILNQHAGAHGGNEGKRQKTVGDGFAKRALRRPFDIDMNPLMIVGAIGELIDAVLIDYQPVAYPDLLSDQSF